MYSKTAHFTVLSIFKEKLKKEDFMNIFFLSITWFHYFFFALKIETGF